MLVGDLICTKVYSRK